MGDEKIKVEIREFNEENRDIEMVEKLERSCEIGSKLRGASIFTNMMGDPLCRIRFFPLYIMLVAELPEKGEIVGVVRGCIKSLGTAGAGVGTGEANTTKIGCILGLRVSPAHRRLGIGLKLVHSVEEWVIRNGANYAFLAIEKKNKASKNLFTHKCNYVKFSSLVIFRQPLIVFPTKDNIISKGEIIKTEKLNIEQAISFYTNTLTTKGGVYPMDFDMILKEKLSLGTWVSYFNQEDWTHLICSQKDSEIYQRMPSSWVVFSIWNTCKAYKFQIRESKHDQLLLPLRFLKRARKKLISCFKMPNSVSFGKSFGFFFLYGIFGEGERVGELVESIWIFASRLAEDEKDCKAIVTELSVSDPIINHVPRNNRSMSCINDNWYLKKLSVHSDDEKDEILLSKDMETAANVIVDPRDF
ncbi:probable N-acetyltransferase HLS1 [Benincasa hispida]|uniref:probable N-acetyltransferase HLS1 n=1 Tax=Benincasa hispida TaxID=102211 RepID=UPI0019015835|nr:probable N-acetyltransferase HLS1 [Benincasa hispida]